MKENRNQNHKYWEQTGGCQKGVVGGLCKISKRRLRGKNLQLYIK